MAYIDLHGKPFDENTIIKLEIFEDYAKAWIPTFVMSDVKEICIFDFFAGTGYDKNGVAGSPIRIIEQIQNFKGYIIQKGVKVKLFFNEFDKKKYDFLVEACNQKIVEDPEVSSHIIIHYYNQDFEELFPDLLEEIKKHPSLVYLDQNGIKFLSEKYFLELEKTTTTDFLYFVASSYFLRFGKRKEFKMNLNIDVEKAKKQKYKFIHREITEQIRCKLPPQSKLKLYPFSIKKGTNIYGIIFGASHPLAVDKFLNISWKKNTENGDANFDIDDEGTNAQLDMFTGVRLSKIDKYKKDLEELLLNGTITNNTQLLEHTYSQGHIPKHSSDCIKELKKKGKIYYEGRSPLVTYTNVYNKTKKKLIEYKIVK